MKALKLSSQVTVSSFFAFLLAVTFSLCSMTTASADLLYSYTDYDYSSSSVIPKIGRITQSGSSFTNDTTDFSLGQSGYYNCGIATFSISGNDRVLVGATSLSDTSTLGLVDGTLMLNLYDADDLSTALATKTISSGLTYMTGVAECGGDILVFGMGNAPTILELDSSTLATKNQYTYSFDGANFDSSNSMYFSEVVVLGGSIYVAFGHANYSTSSGTNNTDRMDFVLMSALGTVTDSYQNFAYPMAMSGAAISGGILYVSLGSNEDAEDSEEADSSKYGIYRTSEVNPDNATRVVEGDVTAICTDGSGGLFYVSGSNLMHWDGSSSSTVDSGLTSSHVNMVYDIRTSTLFTEDVASSSSLMELVVYPNGDASQKQSISSAGSMVMIESFMAVGASPYSDGTGTSSTGTDVYDEDSEEISLPSTVIEAVNPSEISADVLEQIAQTVSGDLHSTDIKFVTTENISAAVNPTKSVYEAIKQDSHEAVYKLNQLRVEEDGWYIFRVNVPEEFQGQSADNFKIYLADQTVFTDASDKARNAALIFGLLNAIEVDSLGLKLETMPAQFLAVAFLQASTPFSVFLGKLLLALLAGGCVAGTGAVTTVMLFVPMLLLKFKRRHK